MAAWATIHISLRTRIELISVATVGSKFAAEKVKFFGDEL